jgi:hypothetical protein
MLLLSTFHLMLQCSVMDAGRCSVCGEESFGTGSDHIRYSSCSCVMLQACNALVSSAALGCSSHLCGLGRWSIPQCLASALLSANLQGEGRNLGSAGVAVHPSIQEQGLGQAGHSGGHRYAALEEVWAQLLQVHSLSTLVQC